MKTCVRILVIAVLCSAMPLLAGMGLRSLLFEDFEGIVPPALPPGWLATNANGDQGIWETKSYGGVNWGRSCIRYVADPVSPGPADDWFFTSGVTLSAGVSHTLEFQYRCSSASHPEALGVYLGLAQDPGSMTGPIWSDGGIVNEDYQQASVGFSVGASGTYYIGFHAESLPGMMRLYVDDVSLLEPEYDLDLKMGMTKSLYEAGIPTYSAGDTIECFASIRNVGSGGTILYKELSLGEGVTDTQLGFDITGPDGLTVPFICKIEKKGPPGARHFVSVPVDSLIGKSLDLWGCYGFDLLGMYTIVAHFQNYSDPDSIGAWKGELLSDPVDIILE
jgi:hypothetical protein